jgi:hypothetical protein
MSGGIHGSLPIGETCGFAATGNNEGDMSATFIFNLDSFSKFKGINVERIDVVI